MIAMNQEEATTKLTGENREGGHRASIAHPQEIIIQAMASKGSKAQTREIIYHTRRGRNDRNRSSGDRDAQFRSRGRGNNSSEG